MSSQPSVFPTPAMRPFPGRRPVDVRKAGWKWLAALVAATCLEGLGRKFLPFLPSTFFYFLKDAILLFGFARFGIPKNIKVAVHKIAGGSLQALVVAGMFFTALQCFNPHQASLALAGLGMKAYWLWLFAPLVVAGALRSEEDARRAVHVMMVVSAIVSVLAVIQFALPGTALFNTYALYEGREMNEIDYVSSTGRVRVSSSFSYVSGFTNFMQLVPPLVLAFALELPPGRRRFTAIVAVCASIATIPMSGSRAPVVLALFNMGLVAWGAGFLNTKIGRRTIAGGLVAVLLSFVVFPEATQGVRDRFAGGTDVTSRGYEFLAVLPFVALSIVDYPLEGTGTGMEQNAAHALALRVSKYSAEGEPARLLVELGPVGYLLIWSIRCAISIALLRAARLLRRTGRGGMAGVALMLAFQAHVGRFVADHVFSALYFLCLGLVLHAAARALTQPAGPSPSRSPGRTVFGAHDFSPHGTVLS